MNPTDPSIREKKKDTEEGKKTNTKQKDTRDPPSRLTDDDYHHLNDMMVYIDDETWHKIDQTNNKLFGAITDLLQTLCDKE